jgi:hypothetical protein
MKFEIGGRKCWKIRIADRQPCSIEVTKFKEVLLINRAAMLSLNGVLTFWMSLERLNLNIVHRGSFTHTFKAFSENCHYYLIKIYNSNNSFLYLINLDKYFTDMFQE